MTEKKRIPEFRFNGFEGEWEEKRFDEYYSVKSGYAFNANDYIEEGVPIINGESINPNNIVSSNFRFLPYEFIDKYKDFIINTNDIVLGLNRPIISNELKIARIPKNLDNSLLYQRAGKIEYKKNISTDYSFYLLNKEIYKFTILEATGSDQPFISTQKLNKWKFYISNLTEQKAIGKILVLIDRIIDLYEKELEYLQSYKQSMLQKMFPKEGEKVPEIRFEGFEGEWLGYKMSEMLDYEQPTNYIVENDDYSEKGIPVLTANKAFILGYTNEDRIYDKGNCIIFDDFTMDFKYVDFEFKVKSSALKILTNTENSNLYFMYNLLQNLNLVSLNHKRHYISFVEKLNLLIPSLQEQFQIGCFFQKLDQQIYIQKEKLENYKNLKMTLINKMFL